MTDEKLSANGGENAGGPNHPAGSGKPRPATGSWLGKGIIPLFRVAGINVSLHWSWFLLAAYEIYAQRDYRSPVWNAVEYLALFGIVLLHEFGHAFACRQTGGKSDRIMLWPLGGIAYVQPPPKPGALLRSIAAGPLVNVALVPVLWLLYGYGAGAGWGYNAPDLLLCLNRVLAINIILLGFNILPFYPLDGGQILQALLWFVIGRSASLLVVTAIGCVAGVAMAGAAIYYNQLWFIVLGVFMVQRSAKVFQHARKLRRAEKMPRIEGFACPECGQKPFGGEMWACDECKTHFNPFITGAICPKCGKTHEKTGCPFCGKKSPLELWRRGN